MGDYGKEATAGDVYAKFNEHCDGSRVNTDLRVIEAIRAVHPNCHVTTISATTCDLSGYAAAGHAALNLDTANDRYIARRNYKAPRSRLEGGLGNLGDSITFGKHKCHWEGQEYTCYLAQWSDPFKQPQNNFYFLTDKSAEEVDDGHTPNVDRLILAASKWTSELHEEIYVFDAGQWTKNKELWTAVQGASWDDVILDPAMKETLIKDVQSFFDNRKLYSEYSVPWKRGIIFHGTPGCGKTISIKALMRSLDKREQPVASLYVKSFDACQGLQYSIRAIFELARAMAPCLLIFEDLDSLVTNEVRSYFLNEVDGLESNDGIMMIGSTNHLEKLDAGISKRPSRFDRKYHYKLPGEQERIAYCNYWKAKLQRNSSIDFPSEVAEIVAKLTEGFSFAYLKELWIQTLLTIVGGRADEDEDDIEIISEKAEVATDSSKLTSNGEKLESTAEGGSDEGAKAEEAKAKRVVPEVHIPEELRANPLMRVLRKQVTALVSEMDNTKDDEVVGGSKVPGDGINGNLDRPVRVMRAC